MKTPTLALLAFGLPILAQATVLTVSNRPGYPAQYATFATAHTAASAGDTLYLTPSPNTYGTATVTKGITIIGGGYAGAAYPVTLAAINLNAGSSGTRMIGMDVGTITLNVTGLTDITIDRVRFTSLVKGLTSYTINGLVIRHCAIGSISLASTAGQATNVEIVNNVFAGNTTAQSISGSSATSVLVANNIFLGLSNNTSYRALGSFTNGLVVNNIFYGRAPAAATGVTDCVFSNNLSFSTFANDLPPAGNTGAGNVVNQNPLFVNVPTFNPAPAVMVTYDYNLQVGSPAIGSGSGGTDMGLYGGSTPLLVPLDGLPRLPHVTSFDLASPVVGQSGTVDGDAEGTKHD